MSTQKQIMGYDKARPITGKMTYILGPCPHRPGTRNKFSGLAQMFDEKPGPQPFTFDFIKDEATPDPSKTMPFTKPLKPTAFTKPLQPLKPKEITMDETETSPADDALKGVCSYLRDKGATDGELSDIQTIWDRIHARKMPAMDSRRRGPRPMTAEENRRFHERFPDAARIRAAY